MDRPTPTKKCRLNDGSSSSRGTPVTQSSSDVSVTGYLSKISPMKLAKSGGNYFLGTIQTDDDEYDDLVGWSTAKRNLLQTFETNCVPVKFSVPSHRVEVTSDGRKKIKIPDLTKIEGAESLPFPDGRRKKITATSCVSVGAIDWGNKCSNPKCGMKMTASSTVSDATTCTTCGMISFLEDCEAFADLSAVFRDEKRNLHNLNVSLGTLAGIGFECAPDANSLLLLKGLKSIGPMLLTVRNEVIIDIEKIAKSGDKGAAKMDDKSESGAKGAAKMDGVQSAHPHQEKRHDGKKDAD